MNPVNTFIYWMSSVILTSSLAIATEFTFDLADNAEECFYESIASDVHCTFEFQASVWIWFWKREEKNTKKSQIDKKSFQWTFKLKPKFIRFDSQVVSGGQLDVDVIVQGPNEKVFYKELRKEYDRFTFNTTVSINLEFYSRMFDMENEIGHFKSVIFFVMKIQWDRIDSIELVEFFFETGTILSGNFQIDPKYLPNLSWSGTH